MQQELRQPVIVVLGHVDSGKTSLLDKIRGTAVQAREVGGITQHIGASFFPLETLKQICGPLFTRMGGEVKVPGLLVIDTPGHEVFANLRQRGGSAADIAILVVDATRGFEVQTYESVEILKSRRVPFLIALNKIDLIPGWRRGSSTFLTDSLKIQDKSVIDDLDRRIYECVGCLSRLGFNSEAFYRVKDFTREVAIVPVSARTGEGIPEVLGVLIGLTQQYLKSRLRFALGSPRGIVLEVKEEAGLGHTANVILLDGVLRVGDRVVVVKREGAEMTKVKAIFMPKPLDEMRDPRDRFNSVNDVVAAAGVKIVTPELEGVLAGSPLLGLDDESKFDATKVQVEGEVKSLFIQTDKNGVVLRTDTLGSLEALVEILRRREVPIRIADIGYVTRRDVIEASAVKEVDPYLGVILAFGVKVLPDAEEEASAKNIRIFFDPIIYNLVQSYLDWAYSEREAFERKIYATLTPPCRFKILKGYIFRRSSPAIFGVEVLAGRLRQKVTVMKADGNIVGTIHQMQDRGKTVEEAASGSQIAVSMSEPTVGRQIDEGDVLYSLPKDDEVKMLLDKYRSRLSEDDIHLLEETIQIRRRSNPLFGF